MQGVFAPFSARLAERAGFSALQYSGAAISGVHFGRPDNSLISMEDMVACTARIVRSVHVPVMADGDNGFGHGYHLALVTDAMADLDPDAHRHTVDKIFPLIGQIGSTAEVLTLLQSAEVGAAPIIP